MRALVCGSRYWDDEGIILTVIEGLATQFECHNVDGEEFVIISGKAKGADTIAEESAVGVTGCGCAIEFEGYPANWLKHGRHAGPIRNQQMLDEGKPDVVYAFTDDLSNSKGTADMCRRAHKAGLPVYVIGRYGAAKSDPAIEKGN